MSDLTEILSKATPEQVEKAKTCKTPDDILSFAKAEGFDMTAEQAGTFLKMMNSPNSELTDEDMGGVAGGKWSFEGTWEPYTVYHAECPNCKGIVTGKTFDRPESITSFSYLCPFCGMDVVSYKFTLDTKSNEPISSAY